MKAPMSSNVRSTQAPWGAFAFTLIGSKMNWANTCPTLGTTQQVEGDLLNATKHTGPLFD
jgi:hypothetical protein